MISKTYEVDKVEFYKKFFSLYNILQTNPYNKIRDREADILSEMIDMNPIWKFKLFSEECLKEVADRVKQRTGAILTTQNIRTNLQSLEKKNLFIKEEDRKKYINPAILKYFDNQSNTFEFVFKFNIK